MFIVGIVVLADEQSNGKRAAITCRHGWDCKFERVHHAALTVASAQDVDSALQTIVDSARDVVGAELAALGVPEESGERLAHFFVSGIPEDHRERIGPSPFGRGLLGLLLREGRALRLDNAQDHPAFSGYPAHHPPIRSFLGIPIQSGGQIFGDLYLANKLGGGVFTEEDQNLIEMLAAHAAVVIQNLRFHQQAQALALLESREQIARQLQDDVLQAMYGVGLQLGALDLRSPEDAASQVGDIQRLLDDAILRLRAHLLSLTARQNGGRGSM
jgi:GAF domain-containing protein